MATITLNVNDSATTSESTTEFNQDPGMFTYKYYPSNNESVYVGEYSLVKELQLRPNVNDSVTVSEAYGFYPVVAITVNILDVEVIQIDCFVNQATVATTPWFNDLFNFLNKTWTLDKLETGGSVAIIARNDLAKPDDMDCTGISENSWTASVTPVGKTSLVPYRWYKIVKGLGTTATASTANCTVTVSGFRYI